MCSLLDMPRSNSAGDLLGRGIQVKYEQAGYPRRSGSHVITLNTSQLKIVIGGGGKKKRILDFAKLIANSMLFWSNKCLHKGQ